MNARKVEDFQNFLGKPLYSNSFNANITEEYKYWLQSYSKNYKTGTIKGYLQRLGEAIRKAEKAGYKVDHGYSEIELPNEEPCTVALTEIEIEKLYSLKRISPEAHAARERFVIACCTGMRFSDISELTTDNLRNGRIIRKTRKTGAMVEIPQHWMVAGILKRNKGQLPALKSQQAFNTMVKRICRAAKITDNILYEQTHGLKVVRKNVKKYTLVSSHTARRSFATNLHLRGIPTGRIMLLTGHTTEQAFFKYIRVNRSENAALLSQHEFFTGKSP